MWEEQSQNQTQAAPAKKGNSSKKLIIMGGVGLVMVLLLIIAGYFFYQYQKSVNLAKTSNSNETAQDLITKLGKTIDLPTNEQPTFATVDNKYSLNRQAFFAKTENGDIVIIYSKNHTAILYRPSSNKVINYATGVAISTQNPTSATPSPVQKVAGTSTQVVTPTPKVQSNLTPPAQASQSAQ